MARTTALEQELITTNNQGITDSSITFYVDETAGDDSNDGLTSGTAWETPNPVYDYIIENNFNTFISITVIFADGTYFFDTDPPFQKLKTGSITFQATNQTLDSVFIGAPLIEGNRVSTIGFTGITFNGSITTSNALVTLNNCFSKTSFRSVEAFDNSLVTINGMTFTRSGYSRPRFQAENHSIINVTGTLTLTETGPINSSTEWLEVFNHSEVNFSSVTITESTTGSTAEMSNMSLFTTDGSILGDGTVSTADTTCRANEAMILPTYDDDAAAGGGGLTAGQPYATTGSGAAPLNAAGIVVLKQ